MQPHGAAQPSGPAPKLEMKVVVLGDKGVGKTCFVLRFIEVRKKLRFAQRYILLVRMLHCRSDVTRGPCITLAGLLYAESAVNNRSLLPDQEIHHRRWGPGQDANMGHRRPGTIPGHGSVIL